MEDPTFLACSHPRQHHSSARSWRRGLESTNSKSRDQQFPAWLIIAQPPKQIFGHTIPSPVTSTDPLMAHQPCPFFLLSS